MNWQRSARAHGLRAWVVAILAGLAVLALPAAASAAPTGMWSFHIDYTINPVPSAACGGLALTDVGTAIGDGSLFRGGQWNSTECIDFVAHPGVVIQRDGHFVITTPDGTLSGLYNGVGRPTGIGRLQTTAVVRLVGGTGAFAGVTGCGTALGQSNVIDTTDNHLDVRGRFGC